MLQRPKHWWRVVTERIDLLTVELFTLVSGGVLALLGYLVPPFPGSIFLQVVGLALVGGSLTGLTGTLTGREAISRQSAKDAALRRKEFVYGPLFDELQELSIIFADVAAGKQAAPLRIDNSVAIDDQNARQYDPHAKNMPTLIVWPPLSRGFRNWDFSPKAKSLLDKVQEDSVTYNAAVEAARGASVPILAVKINAAIATEQQLARYARWKRQQESHEASSAMTGQQLTTTFDWFRHFEGENGQMVALRWLTMWPAGPSPARSLVLGWLLAGKPDRAALYVQQGYPPNVGTTYSQPELTFLQPIFEQALPELQQDEVFHAAIEAKDALVKSLQDALDMLTAGLSDIQERYEGGKPTYKTDLRRL